MAFQPLALTPCLPPDLLSWLLTHQTYPTTLLICTSRSTFLTTLLASLPLTPDLQNSTIDNPTPALHPLLIPTLFQTASSRHLQVIFTPTLSHLRAYLAVFPDSEVPPPPLLQEEMETVGKGTGLGKEMGPRTPLLVVWGLVGVHRETSEWSAQGLGGSIAALVEAGRRRKRGIVLVEGKEEGTGGAREEVGEAEGGEGGGETGGESWDDGEQEEEEMLLDDEKKPETRRRQGKEREVGWRERLPILNGSSRRLGMDSADEGWSGRTVEVGTVLRRWFVFRKGEWDEDKDERSGSDVELEVDDAV